MSLLKKIIPIVIIKRLYDKTYPTKGAQKLSDEQKDAIEDAKDDKN